MSFRSILRCQLYHQRISTETQSVPFRGPEPKRKCSSPSRCRLLITASTQPFVRMIVDHKAENQKVPIGHRSGSTFAAMSGERVIRYIALLHLRTQTPRSGRERLASLAARSALSQVKPCARICTASIDCSVSAATGVAVVCCARTNGLKTTAAAARSIDPSSLYTTVLLLAV
jgi:hypothetical protein